MRGRRFIIPCLIALTACTGPGEPAAVVALTVEPLPIFFKSYKWGRNGYRAVISLDRDSTGVPMPFGQAIIDAYRQWQFEPLVVDGRAVPVCLMVSTNINWK